MNSTWMQTASCPDRLDLPWRADCENVTVWEHQTMAAICDHCPVLLACTAFVAAEDITGGFWAGRHRDHLAVKKAEVNRPARLVASELPGFGDAA